LFETVWQKYPRRIGKKAAERAFKATVATTKDFEDIQTALRNYVGSKAVREGYVQHGSTWFNNWRDWIDYQEENTNGTYGGKSPISYQDLLRKRKEAEKLREDLAPREVPSGVGDMPNA
jgi:hypothetical protein